METFALLPFALLREQISARLYVGVLIPRNTPQRKHGVNLRDKVNTVNRRNKLIIIRALY